MANCSPFAGRRKTRGNNSMKTLASLLRISLLAVLVTVLFWAYATMAQTESGTISGLITDETGAAIPGAQVQLLNVQRGTSSDAKTNNAGLYIFSGVEVGQYQIKVQKPGFKQVDLLSLIVNVQDHIEQNVRLQVGSVSESVTVNASEATINTTDATVSTIVDRQFAENLPLNGRSFQTLIQLTPGVVVAPTTPYDAGQFSVNGQRGASNYWMVDGVSANVGVSSNSGIPGNGLGGALPAFSVQGGTSGLVSVDAMQEFRIQTSTFAPEFGRTPGAQISIATRSGTNHFHGTLFDYFRNDVLDANDWFANKNGLPKPEERQNDFGGTFSGPIANNNTFFFFSYEGLRLRLPQVAATTVPDLNSRQSAIPAVQPFLNAFPLPNGADLGNGTAQFNASFSNKSTLDAYSLRIDQKLTNKLNLFGRYNYSPSELVQRGIPGFSLSTTSPSQITAQTATIGTTWLISQATVNEFRFNYSRFNAFGHFTLDDFGGATPLVSSPFPTPFSEQDSEFAFTVNSLTNSHLVLGQVQRNLQQQVNAVDSLSTQRGLHSLKFGADFRRLSPRVQNQAYNQQNVFSDVPSAETGNLSFTLILAARNAEFLFHNLSFFVQDTWRLRPRLTLTYGLRWDMDFAPSSKPPLSAVTGFNLNDLSQLALASSGTQPFHTTYGNFAPRVGVAYQLSGRPAWETVLRGGFGVFYDLVSSEVGNGGFIGAYPFGALKFGFGGNFPLDPATAAPPPITQPGGGAGTLTATDPHLRLPYTLEWNFAVEQALGRQQSISATYLGAAGRRLLQTAEISSPNPNYGGAILVGNTAVSDYHALQLQFSRRLSRGLQVLSSYTWSHSIDTASAGSVFGNPSNAFVPTLNPSANRGPSDFDVRNAFSAGITYDLPAPKMNAFTKAILQGWSAQNVIQARTAPPVDVFDSDFFSLVTGARTNVRPDRVPGQSFYLFGPQYPDGKALNAAAFASPPLDPNSGSPVRQGDLPRNALRGFGAVQWDLAIHRDFSIRESLKLQFRAEMFNVINHPNFGPPFPDLANQRQFGQSLQMLGQSLAAPFSQGAGGFSPLYQIGGPRSIQLALKLIF